MRRLWCKESFVGQLEFGYLPLHALCFNSPQTGHPYIQSQVIEYGHMDGRTGRGGCHNPPLISPLPLTVTRI